MTTTFHSPRHAHHPCRSAASIEWISQLPCDISVGLLSPRAAVAAACLRAAAHQTCQAFRVREVTPHGRLPRPPHTRPAKTATHQTCKDRHTPDLPRQPHGRLPRQPPTLSCPDLWSTRCCRCLGSSSCHIPPHPTQDPLCIKKPRADTQGRWRGDFSMLQRAPHCLVLK